MVLEGNREKIWEMTLFKTVSVWSCRSLKRMKGTPPGSCAIKLKIENIYVNVSPGSAIWFSFDSDNSRADFFLGCGPFPVFSP